MRPTNRRQFLKNTLATSSLVSMGSLAVPTFLSRSALAAKESKNEGKILVVVQLDGGNDGLNTVVPHGIDGYVRNRRVLRIPGTQAITINQEIGLHPAMTEMARLLESGNLSILQGVGYPNPDRSHFRSMEIWETARTENGPEALETGWLGRVLDAHPPAPGEDTPALHIGGGNLPLAYRSKQIEVPSLERVDQFRLQFSDSDDRSGEVRTAMNNLAGSKESDDPLLGFLRRSTLAAYESSARLEEVGAAESETEYPNYGLARRLEQIAQIIKAGFGTKIYYTRQGGYDTHANQFNTHQALLTELSDSVAAFHDDLEESGVADRVAVLVFSEFGRRVRENGSSGTDHGAAAPVFVLGPVREAGLVGDHPSLEDLDDGDLKFQIDFRNIYAGLLETWLKLPAAPILGLGFQGLDILKTS